MEEDKMTMMEKAHGLGEKFLRHVSKEKTAAGVWRKLEGFYMTKFFANRLYLKKVLYSFKISEDKVLAEQLDMFNKLILDLENIDVNIDDEDQVLLLLYALPRSHANFKEIILYVRESLAFEEFQSAMYSKDLNERKKKNPSSFGEGFPIKEKFSKKDGKYEKREDKVL